MYKIVESVKDNKGIEITEGIDDICQFCPNRMDDKCSSEEKVTKIDNNVIKLLDIEIKKYQYIDIEKIIMSLLTNEVFNTICNDCEWKKSDVCHYEDVKKKFG